MNAITKQIEARKRLVLSAKMACRNGFSQDQWENTKEILDFTLKTGLPMDTVRHIGVWIWTFRR